MTETLKKLVEQVWGDVPSTPKQFEALSKSIFSATHQQISVSTLKRIWGYVSSDHSPRRDVLDILSFYCGYVDWEAFSNAISEGRGATDSHIMMGENIEGHTIRNGKKVRVAWQPDSVCTFQSQGNARFTVLESQGSKLPVGATFVCRLFIQGEPLYLTDLILHPSETPVSYVCGRDGGVRFAL